GRLDQLGAAESGLGELMSVLEGAPDIAESLEKLRIGSLGIVETLAPGEERSFEFVLAWHFPNRQRAWGSFILENTNAGQRIRNFYATTFDDAWAVARHLHANMAELERQTLRFHDSLYGSSLPPEIVDAVASNITALRSTTCFRIEDGTFCGWEGSMDRV